MSDALEKQTLEIHLERYAFAARHLSSGNILDLACGVGYGCYLLAEKTGSSSLYGVDADQESIQYARRKYAHKKIQFVIGDAANFNPPEPVSNIVSLETIEHLRQPEIFLKHIAGLLPIGGRLIASVPITPSMDINPFHLHDFTRDSFCKMLVNNNFKLLDSMVQVQKYEFNSLFKTKTKKYKLNITGILKVYMKHPAKIFTRLHSLAEDGLSNKYFVGVFEKR